MDNLIQETCYISTVSSGPDESNNFNEAWNHQCPNERRKWKEAIRKELNCMESRKVGRLCKADVPNDSVGSPQVSFLTCTLEIPQENCSTSSLLLTLFTFTFEPFLKP